MATGSRVARAPLAALMALAAACGSVDPSTPSDGPAPVDASNGADRPLAAPRTCKEIHERDGAAPSGTYTVRIGSGGDVQVYCDMETAGGGWTLLFHVFDLGGAGGLREQQFIDLFHDNLWTNHSWSFARDSATIAPAAASGPVPLMAQGGLDIGLFEGWTDLRMACHRQDRASFAEQFVEIDGYADVNANRKLLGGAPNGTAYTVAAASNSMHLTKIWHDNEPITGNGYHYLCDVTNNGTGAAQFGFCYTDFLNDPNAPNGDSGDSIVTIAFGSKYGGDESAEWSNGFTAECGNMGSGATGALQNAGTFWLWIR